MYFESINNYTISRIKIQYHYYHGPIHLAMGSIGQLYSACFIKSLMYTSFNYESNPIW